MGNTFREVKCFKCGHIFIWQKNGIAYPSEYRLESTSELLGIAICPKCGTDMLVIRHVLEGISKDSKGIVESGIWGI